MPILFIIAGVAAVATLIALMVVAPAKDHGTYRFIIPGIGLLVTVLLLIFASLTIVPTREVGVVLTFGKPAGTLENGLHWKKPWQRVVDMDGTIQTQDNTVDRRTEIRLGNQATAFVQNTLRWSIKTDAADDLYLDYRKFENIEGSLVMPELAAALNSAFSTYDPLVTAEGAQSYDQVSEDVKKRLQERVGDRIVIHSLIIPKVDFDEATQKRIDALQTEIGNTRIAEQQKETARARAAANRELAASVSKDPNVIVSQCMDMVASGVSVPPGFSCWPGDSGTPLVTTTPAKP